MAFWWGGYVIPELLRLIFPEVRVPSGIASHMSSDSEGSLANAVSGAALAVLALLALTNAFNSRRQAAGWLTIGGWTALAVTAAMLAWSEFGDQHSGAQAALSRLMFRDAVPVDEAILLVASTGMATLAAALAAAVFVRKGLRRQAVRMPFALGFTAWVLAVLHEVAAPILFARLAPGRDVVLEETLEFSGTLLLVLSAVIALRGEPASSRVARAFGGHWRTTLAGSIATVTVLGGLVVMAVFRPPFVDTRAHSSVGAFHVHLQDERSAMQELGLLTVPIEKIDVRLGMHDPNGRSGVVSWHLLAGESREILREGRVTVPTRRDHLIWVSLDFKQPVVLPPGQSLAIQFVADVAPDAHIRIGATKTNRYAEGRLWVNGKLTWPDQNLELVAYGRPEPTLSKLRAVWRTLTSDWRWPVLATDLAITLTVIVLCPALLLATALSRPSPVNRRASDIRSASFSGAEATDETSVSH